MASKTPSLDEKATAGDVCDRASQKDHTPETITKESAAEAPVAAFAAAPGPPQVPDGGLRAWLVIVGVRLHLNSSFYMCLSIILTYNVFSIL